MDIKYQSVNTEYKWYTNLFPATINQPANNRMAKLFQAEKLKMAKLDKAEILQKSTTARKRSLLPICNFFITLYIFTWIWQIHNCILCLRVWWSWRWQWRKHFFWWCWWRRLCGKMKNGKHNLFFHLRNVCFNTFQYVSINQLL